MSQKIAADKNTDFTLGEDITNYKKYKSPQHKKINFARLPVKTKNALIRFLTLKKINFNELKSSRTTTVKFMTENHVPILVVIRGDELRNIGLKSPVVS
jgi:hypothetical protein